MEQAGLPHLTIKSPRQHSAIRIQSLELGFEGDPAFEVRVRHVLAGGAHGEGGQLARAVQDVARGIGVISHRLHRKSRSACPVLEQICLGGFCRAETRYLTRFSTALPWRLHDSKPDIPQIKAVPLFP